MVRTKPPLLPDTTTANADFLSAVHRALVMADDKQVALFDTMFGKPHPDTAFELPPALAKSVARRSVKVSDDKAGTGMELGAFLNMVDGGVDYRADDALILPDALRQQLEEFREDFVRHASWVKDEAGLLKFFDRIIAREHDRLFYRTNDYMSASIHLDYAKQFIDQLCVQLNKAGLLSPELLDRLEEMETIHKLGLDAYGCFNEYLAEMTTTPTGSILQEAKNAYLEKRELSPDTQQHIPPVELEIEAHDVVHELLQANFAFEGKYRVMPPLMVLLLEKSDRLARLQLAEKHPHLDFRHPDLEAGDELQNRYMSIIESWRKRVTGTPSPRDMYAVYVDLDKQVKMLEHLPENFDALVAKAKEAGLSALDTNEFTAFRDHENTRPFLRALMSKQQSTDSVEAYRASLPTVRRRIKRLSAMDSKEELLQELEVQVDMLSDDCAYHGAHPATFFALQYFMEAFRKHLGGAMFDAGHHDARFLARLKEVEDKIDLASENHRVIAHWTMQDTNGGHDNPYCFAMLGLGFKGDDPTPQERAKFSAAAEEGCREAAIARGIPEAWATVPYLPLIMARCHDIAGAIMARVVTKSDNDYEQVEVPRVNQQWVDIATGTGSPYASPYDYFEADQAIEPDTLEMIRKVNQMSRRIFRGAMSCLMPQNKREEWLALAKKSEEEIAAMPDGPPGSPEHKARQAATEEKVDAIIEKLAEFPAEPSAYNLRQVLEYLDHMEQQRTPRTMH